MREINLSTVRFTCWMCGEEVDHEVDLLSIGSNDPTVIVKPCSDCYHSDEELKETLGEAKNEVEHDVTMTVLAKLLGQARVMSSNDLDLTPDISQEGVLRQIIGSHEDLDPFLYLIDKQEGRHGKEESGVKKS